VVLAQWVSFEERPGRGTRVHTWGDIVHSGVKIAGRTAEQVITSFTETWYENFRSACDRLAETSAEDQAVGSLTQKVLETSSIQEIAARR